MSIRRNTMEQDRSRGVSHDGSRVPSNSYRDQRPATVVSSASVPEHGLSPPEISSLSEPSPRNNVNRRHCGTQIMLWVKQKLSIFPCIKRSLEESDSTHTRTNSASNGQGSPEDNQQDGREENGRQFLGGIVRTTSLEIHDSGARSVAPADDSGSETGHRHPTDLYPSPPLESLLGGRWRQSIAFNQNREDTPEPEEQRPSPREDHHFNFAQGGNTTVTSSDERPSSLHIGNSPRSGSL
jgi:hypothetical protein